MGQIDERLAAHGVRMLLKRDDLIHPELPRNKWRKLKLNVDRTATAGGELADVLEAEDNNSRRQLAFVARQPLSARLRGAHRRRRCAAIVGRDRLDVHVILRGPRRPSDLPSAR